jgi:flagellar protein FliS
MNAYRRYAQTQIQTASPERTLMMLLEGALARIRQGIEQLEAGNRRDGVHAITKASDIVLELERTLRPEVAPELCQQLASIYQFAVLRLTHAAASGETESAVEAEAALVPVVEGFRQVIGDQVVAGSDEGN